MDRRSFLKATLVGAGGVLAVGCGDDGGPEGALSPDRSWFPQSVASGDPKPTSVILWTRATDPGGAGGDVALLLELSTSDDFTDRVALDGATTREVIAEAAYDHCAKVRLTGLSAATTYFYRFRAPDGAASPVGRTTTAPADDADVAVRFAVASCQDLNGRYFNSYARMLAEDAPLDFVLHLGDYVYETTSDPRFQDATEARQLVFARPDDALQVGRGGRGFLAANSLDNYRDLYRTYRADPDLQAAHERWPFLHIWDDHEFSDDSWGDSGTYHDGAVDERDVARRKAANQAWYEYMPVDWPAGPDFRYDPSAPFPGDLRIHRELRYGRHLHLVLTDLRTYRADHPIPEDAYPGAVAIDEATLSALTGGAPPPGAGPYVDTDTLADGAYREALRRSAPEGFDREAIGGLMDVAWINRILAARAAAGEADDPPPIDPDGADVAGTGVAYVHLGKRGPYAILGARQFADADLYDLVARARWDATDGASEVIMGAEQEGWFLETMKASDATWKVWANEFLLMPLRIDVRAIESLPADFRKRFYITMDDWTGVPNRRAALLTELSQLDNVVALTGDIHAFFAGTPMVDDDPATRIVELVTAGISSSALRNILVRIATADDTLREAGAVALAAGIKSFFLDRETAPNPHMAHANVDAHGYMVVAVDADRLDARLMEAPSTAVTSRLEGAALDAAFTPVEFQVDAGSPELYRVADGARQRWDPSTLEWVAA